MEVTGKCRVLDGGFSTELHLSHDVPITGDPLWGSRMIQTNPNAVRKVHRSFLEAGSDVVETGTYQASMSGFMQHLSIDSSEAERLFLRAVELCSGARDSFWDRPENRKDRVRPEVAGSVGPYGACQADLSEYTGAYVDTMSIEELMAWHRPQVTMLVRAGVDLLAFETLPAQKEAEAIVKLLREFPTCHAWLSFSCKDGSTTHHGEHITDASRVSLQSDQIIAVGINCTAPTDITSLLTHIPQQVKLCKQVVVYPNSGEDMSNPQWPRVKTIAKRLCDYVDCWMDNGATWIGGCCAITPADIRNIRTAMLSHLSPPLQASTGYQSPSQTSSCSISIDSTSSGPA